MKPKEPQPDESGASPVSTPIPKTRQALSRLKRELSEEELGHTGVQKLLIAEVERLDEENRALVSFRDLYHEKALELAGTEAQLKEKRAADIISMGCMALGGVVFGYAPVLSGPPDHSKIAMIVGGVLLVIGIAAKVVLRS